MTVIDGGFFRRETAAAIRQFFRPLTIVVAAARRLLRCYGLVIAAVALNLALIGYYVRGMA
jgi:hypothetical protein